MSELKAVLLSEDGIILRPRKYARNSNFQDKIRSQKLFLHYHPYLSEAGESRMLPIGIELVNGLKPCERYVYKLKAESHENGLHPWNFVHTYSEFVLNLSKDATHKLLSITLIHEVHLCQWEFISCNNRLLNRRWKSTKKLTKSTPATIPSQIESTSSSSGEWSTPLLLTVIACFVPYQKDCWGQKISLPDKDYTLWLHLWELQNFLAPYRTEVQLFSQNQTVLPIHGQKWHLGYRNWATGGCYHATSTCVHIHTYGKHRNISVVKISSTSTIYKHAYDAGVKKLVTMPQTIWLAYRTISFWWVPLWPHCSDESRK